MLLCEFYLNVLKDFAHLLNPTQSVLNLPLRPYGLLFSLIPTVSCTGLSAHF